MQGLKLRKLVKEILESRSMNSKSPTSLASEPIYLTTKTYFNNQSQASKSTSSIVMLNLDEVWPSYCAFNDFNRQPRFVQAIGGELVGRLVDFAESAVQSNTLRTEATKISTGIFVRLSIRQPREQKS